MQTFPIDFVIPWVDGGQRYRDWGHLPPWLNVGHPKLHIEDL